ncbi:PilW family protein [Clostridium tagluense]|uniref:PilW family protein n=1 Tax=Clostridium tagluense TaxID=360422 RepID=UPI001C6EF595|nr:prepilin-type N-terminal cleavage/methylation domain-containing protein [Clostridium tagluense]MBW9155235.1 prepilin-type N-terminal cleavage/methylation domain-containing protein [Clostridium tagluense]WLC64667.1 prepilin-type N-terminal cleavage/methylation domain-containing protein [Clostridium tagluense]
MTVKKKGITLIELIIAMAILFIVLSVISSFFFTNYKTLNLVNKDLELQSQGEKVINFMVDNIIDGYSVLEVVDIADDKDKKAESKEISIKRLSIQRLKAGGEKYKFELEGNALNFYKGEEGKKEICNDVSTIILTPLPLKKSFIDCKGVRIEIKLKLDKVEKKFVNEIYLRNKEIN